eukprot:scaffold341_cov368-Pavlova_lutheri.AAC.1
MLVAVDGAFHGHPVKQDVRCMEHPPHKVHQGRSLSLAAGAGFPLLIPFPLHVRAESNLFSSVSVRSRTRRVFLRTAREVQGKLLRHRMAPRVQSRLQQHRRLARSPSGQAIVDRRRVLQLGALRRGGSLHGRQSMQLERLLQSLQSGFQEERPDRSIDLHGGQFRVAFFLEQALQFGSEVRGGAFLPLDDQFPREALNADVQPSVRGERENEGRLPRAACRPASPRGGTSCEEGLALLPDRPGHAARTQASIHGFQQVLAARIQRPAQGFSRRPSIGRHVQGAGWPLACDRVQAKGAGDAAGGGGPQPQDASLVPLAGPQVETDRLRGVGLALGFQGHVHVLRSLALLGAVSVLLDALQGQHGGQVSQHGAHGEEGCMVGVHPLLHLESKHGEGFTFVLGKAQRSRVFHADHLPVEPFVWDRRRAQGPPGRPSRLGRPSGARVPSLVPSGSPWSSCTRAPGRRLFVPSPASGWASSEGVGRASPAAGCRIRLSVGRALRFVRSRPAFPRTGAVGAWRRADRPLLGIRIPTWLLLPRLGGPPGTVSSFGTSG